jgi:hypothetical protein
MQHGCARILWPMTFSLVILHGPAPLPADLLRRGETTLAGKGGRAWAGTSWVCGPSMMAHALLIDYTTGIQAAAHPQDAAGGASLEMNIL